MATIPVPRRRRSDLDGPGCRALRQATGCTPKQWADLLDCPVEAVYNMESTQVSVSKPLARLMRLLTVAAVRKIAARLK